MIPFAKPIVGDEEIEAVKSVLKSGMLAEGKIARQFEGEFAKYVGTKFATVTSNGTTALSTALEALGIQPGDEVITSPFTFIASANTIAMLGAVPVFVDIKLDTYNIDPDLIEAAITDRTKAIMPIHIFGMPADMKRIMEIASKHDLLVIEDACQAHGATIDGKMVGSFGHAGTYSFYATKNMMTGEGGMVTTNDEEVLDRMLSIKNHGRGKEGGYSHFRIGYNNRMLDMVAAIGLEQLKRMPKVVTKRRRTAQMYNNLFSEYDSIKPQAADKGFESGYHLYAPRLCSDKMSRDQIVKALRDNGVGSRAVYALPCHKQNTYLDINEWRWAKYVKYPDYSKVSLPISEEVGAAHFDIPVHPMLTEDEIEHISSAFRKILD
ncbi:MAG: DegT/DnrJ/EryC1/StrS family aminotransferase [Candidatus Thorarchaeota archaeon]|jgi:dTDP-4-amino-4,6-dideoxygalactose transaminase|nr:DegT/DnrJ/EryC1/StrS family aminotransferase [Candidatus Thorarchaeota archaeon]